MNNRFAFLPMRTANDLIGQPEKLRLQLEEDGYLLFKQVLDRTKVNHLRLAILRVLAARGWVEPVKIPATGRCLVTPLRENDEEYQAGYREVQKLELFHTMAHDPALMAIMADVVGQTAFPHPLKVARLAFPDHFEATTPPHQDHPNNQGTAHLTAAWVPVWDMPPEMGGLAVLRGSHRWGVLPLARHLGPGNRCVVIPPEMAEQCRWVTTDYEMGDLLVFPSLTVHASLHNASEFFMRLSVDFRYQQEGEALTEGVLRPHFGDLDWDEVYEDWESEDFQYYWRDLDYEITPFEEFPMVDHEPSAEFTRAELKEIYHYHERVDARTARRLDALNLDD